MKRSTQPVIYQSLPLEKGDITIEFICELIGKEYDLQVAVKAAGERGIFRDLPTETDGMTQAEIVVWVVKYYLQNVLPFGHSHAADLSQIKSIMQAHQGDGFPFRTLVEAGWVLGESLEIRTPASR